MALKHIVVKEKTRILFNKAVAKILTERPQIKKLTDDAAMVLILKNFVGGK